MVDNNSTDLQLECVEDGGYIKHYGYAYRILFPSAGLIQFSFITSFLLHSFDYVDEERQSELHQDEIYNLLFTRGSRIANNLQEDFREVGIYPPTFLRDLKDNLHLFPHEFILAPVYSHRIMPFRFPWFRLPDRSPSLLRKLR